MILFRTFLRQYSLRTGIAVLSLLCNIFALSILAYKLLAFLASPARIALSPFTHFYFYIDVVFLGAQPILSLYGHLALRKRYYPAIAAFRSWTLFFLAMRLFAGGFSIIGFVKDDVRWMAACTRNWTSTGMENGWKILIENDHDSGRSATTTGTAMSKTTTNGTGTVAIPAYWCYGRYLSHIIALSFLWATDLVTIICLFLCVHSYKRIYFITEEEQEARAFQEELRRRNQATGSKRMRRIDESFDAHTSDVEVQDEEKTAVTTVEETRFVMQGGSERSDRCVASGGGGDIKTIFEPRVRSSNLLMINHDGQREGEQVILPVVQETPPTPDSGDSSTSLLW